jgi:hypothetical protein
VTQKTPAAKVAKKARKTIKRMMRDPIKWRAAEHIYSALGANDHLITAQGAYLLASQIVDDITPLILGASEDETTKE